MKPLFVPLKTRWFRDFQEGRKRVEYRRYGPGWNERTCVVGRPVTLSHGYSGARLHGIITRFRVVDSSTVPAAAELYGKNVRLAAISVQI